MIPYHAAKTARINATTLNESDKNVMTQEMKAKKYKAIKIGLEVLDEIKAKIYGLIAKYEDVFAFDPTKLGHAKHYKYHIETGDAPPQRMKPFNLTESEHKVINKNVDELLEKDLIESSINYEDQSTYHAWIWLPAITKFNWMMKAEKRQLL